MAAFDYRQAEEIRHAFARHGCRYLFLGKSGAIAPDGIEHFEDAWRRRAVVEGFPVCHIDDIIASKVATNRQKDRKSLPRLESFRLYVRHQQRA